MRDKLRRFVAISMLGASLVPTSAWSQPAPAPKPAPAPEDPYDAPPPPTPAPASPDAPPPTPPTPKPTTAPIPGLTLQEAEALAAKAKDLNRQGLKLLEAGDTERALEHFMASRKVLPTTKNVANAALALDRLGRYDEALEQLEELLKQFAGGLDDEDRAAIGPMMEGLRAQVGYLDVSSNVGGTVLIDGRERAKLPLITPIRIVKGKHRIRVVKNGFESYDTDVESDIGQHVTVNAELRPLQGVGQLIVEDESLSAADVFVDGSKVGVVPWEGSLSPGEHFVWLQKKERGTAPAKVVIVEGQAALLSMKSVPLGAPLRVVSEPAAAVIELEGTKIGSGTWAGRLPLGSYNLRVSEPGYHEKTLSFQSSPGQQEQALNVSLPLDPDHPRWPKPVKGEIWLEAFGGVSGGDSLNGSAADYCPQSCDGGAGAFGFMAGGRGGYRFPFGLSAELGAGYWRLGQSFDRTVVDGANTTGSLQVQDDILVHGPFAAVGINYRLFVDDAEKLHLLGRASVGALLANSRDRISGASVGTSGALLVENRNESVTSIDPFLMPELGIGYQFGSLSLGLGLGVGIFFAEAPEFDRGRVGVGESNAGSEAQTVRETTVLDDEVAYASFLLWVPQASIGWTL